MSGSFAVVPGAAAGPSGVVSGRVWSGVLREVPEAREVDRARVARDEAPALLSLEPGLDVNAIVGGHAPRAFDLVVVAEHVALAIRVEVWRGGARQHGDDADLVAAEAWVLVAVVGADGADRLRHARLPAWRRSARVRYRLPFARPSRRICEVGEERDLALPLPRKEAVMPAWLRTSSRS